MGWYICCYMDPDSQSVSQSISSVVSVFVSSSTIKNVWGHNANVIHSESFCMNSKVSLVYSAFN